MSAYRRVAVEAPASSSIVLVLRSRPRSLIVAGKGDLHGVKTVNEGNRVHLHSQRSRTRTTTRTRTIGERNWRFYADTPTRFSLYADTPIRCRLVFFPS